MKPEEQSDLAEAQALLNARWMCSNEELASKIEIWVRELLFPLCEEGHAEARYLLSALGGEEVGVLSEAEFDESLLKQYREGAESEVPEAQFQLAHWHWERGNHAKAADLYKKAAAQGHAYAMWCIGLDLISGRGIERNEKDGIAYIKQSADLKFEGAIQFISNAYALGQYGFPVDEAQAAEWQRKLSLDDLIRF